jgi:hypothetical protein
MGVVAADVAAHARIESAGGLVGFGLAFPGQYTADQQQYCSGDACRLCGSEIPDIDRITACMIRNKSQLSPECRRVFGPPPSASAPGEPADVKPASIRKLRSHRSKMPQSADAS